MDMKEWSTDRIERLAIDAETEIARQRAVQAAALAELDHRQTPTADGCRTLVEWTASRLDVSPETARDLVRVSRGISDRPDLAAALASGDAGFDRVVALCGSQVGVGESFGWDIAGLRRMITRWSRTVCEPMPYTDRYLAIQPSLDQSRWKLWGQLTGDAGAIVEQALTERADTFPTLPDGTREPMAARRADALLTLCADSVSSPGLQALIPPPGAKPRWERWRRQAPERAMGRCRRRRRRGRPATTAPGSRWSPSSSTPFCPPGLQALIPPPGAKPRWGRWPEGPEGGMGTTRPEKPHPSPPSWPGRSSTPAPSPPSPAKDEWK